MQKYSLFRVQILPEACEKVSIAFELVGSFHRVFHFHPPLTAG